VWHGGSNFITKWSLVTNNYYGEQQLIITVQGEALLLQYNKYN